MACSPQLDGDLGARVARSDDQHRARAQLRRAPVLARVQLDDPRVELAGERRQLGLLVARHRHHHLARQESLLARRHEIPVTGA
jgi:hypothetical protein